eukprot:5800673-Amphidinium_carterae.1
MREERKRQQQWYLNCHTITKRSQEFRGVPLDHIASLPNAAIKVRLARASSYHCNSNDYAPYETHWPQRSPHLPKFYQCASPRQKQHVTAMK